MHLPDHFLDTPTTVATTAVAAAAVAMAVQRSRGELAQLAAGARDAVDARSVVRSRIGLTAATTGLVFAVQMLNYPVGAGTSGHLLGGALAAALVGPALGMLSIAAVLVVQALVFADGGLTALGPNVLLLAVIGTLVGWGVARAVQATSARRAGPRAVPLSAAAGALASVPVAAAAFAALFSVGGTAAVPAGQLMSQMVGVHALIGLGEAAITAGVLGLVHALSPGAAALARVAVPSAASAASAAPAARAMAPVAAVRRAAVVLGGLAAVAAVAISPFAAATPDGLEATAASIGFAGAARDHAFAGAPLADYGAGAQLFVGVAGALGVVVCAVLIALVLRTVRPAAPTSA